MSVTSEKETVEVQGKLDERETVAEAVAELLQWLERNPRPTRRNSLPLPRRMMETLEVFIARQGHMPGVPGAGAREEYRPMFEQHAREASRQILLARMILALLVIPEACGAKWAHERADDQRFIISERRYAREEFLQNAGRPFARGLHDTTDIPF